MADRKVRKDNCVAYGEVTGHAHRLDRKAVVYEDGNGAITLESKDGSTVTHEEHKPIALPPGDIDVSIVQEYDHFAEEAREVMD